MALDYLNFTPDLVAYIRKVGLRQTQEQEQLHGAGQKLYNPNLQSAPEVAAFIAFLIKLTGAKNVAEIGTFTGYTTLAMALSVPKNGTVTTFEKDPEIFKIGQPYWQQAGVDHKIKVVIGDAVPQLDEHNSSSFDLIFIDADKRSYQKYYEKSLTLVKPNGLILIDNTLWKGTVADAHSDDKRAPDLRQLNQFIHQDPRVDMYLLPISDGLTCVRKVGDGD